MSVMANKCMYYQKSDTTQKTCNKGNKIRPCKFLLGQNCKDFCLKSKYEKDLLIQQNKNIKIEKMRQKLLKYKEKNHLSILSLSIQSEISYNTISNFLKGNILRVDKLKTIEKFVKII